MWDWFINFLYVTLEQLQGLLGDWGLAIIVLTFIIRLILTPLTVKSTKSSARMQALQPQLKAIQERYADDPEAQASAMREFYANNKFNPLGGCLPVLLQMPIFFALFAVLRDKLPQEAHFYGIIDSLAQSVSGAIATSGISGAAIFIALDVLFGILTLVPMLLNAKNTPAEQKQQMMIMGVVMSLMMVWVGWGIPAGVLLYYDTSAIWGVVQQVFITQKVMEDAKAAEEERLANAPIDVDVVRRERKPRPRKKN